MDKPTSAGLEAGAVDAALDELLTPMSGFLVFLKDMRFTGSWDLPTLNRVIEVGETIAAQSSALIPPSRAVESVAWQDVIAERQRQVGAEGWTIEHDDQHKAGELADAAACYAASAKGHGFISLDRVPSRWPWSRDWWKPSGRRRDLVKAAALIIAEIERLDRAAKG